MIYTILAIIISIVLIVVILLQAPGTGLSPVFGGGGEAYRSKRSVQKFLMTATIIFAALLALFSFIMLFLQK